MLPSPRIWDACSNERPRAPGQEPHQDTLGCLSTGRSSADPLPWVSPDTVLERLPATASLEQTSPAFVWLVSVYFHQTRLVRGPQQAAAWEAGAGRAGAGRPTRALPLGRQLWRERAARLPPAHTSGALLEAGTRSPPGRLPGSCCHHPTAVYSQNIRNFPDFFPADETF